MAAFRGRTRRFWITAAVLTAGVASPLVLLLVAKWTSPGSQARGVVAGRLALCPSSPHCVCSEPGEMEAAAIAPLELPDGLEPAACWEQLRFAIRELPRTQIRVDDGAYLHAEYESAVFGFIDDLECRLDADARVIHARSTSRAGHSDMGFNRSRVEQLRQLLQSRLSRAQSLKP